jgi:release factor glutamine methyltransferase
MPTIRTLLADARHALMQALGLPADEARLEARLLLLHLLQVDHAWLLAHETDALQGNIHAAFQALLARRLQGEPIAHILGKREFYGLELTVSPDTLIPRPDTETLVEAALAQIPDTIEASRKFKVLDLGTGTGAIALAIASQRAHAEVVAVDASAAALAIAMGNAKRLGLSNVRFLLSDWFANLGSTNQDDDPRGEKFDVIVSNPPYIAAQDPHLSQGDLRFEPLSALASGADGLDDIRRIIADAPQHLNASGWLMLEHGYDQAATVRRLLGDQGFGEVDSARDLAGIERISLGQWAG